MTNNPRKIVGLEGYGIEIVGREPIEVGCCATNEEYMRTKQEKWGTCSTFPATVSNERRAASRDAAPYPIQTRLP